MARPYFDIHCTVGRQSARDPRLPYHAEALAEDMRYFGISAAAVTHAAALSYSFVQGNNELLALLQNQPRLVGVAALPPTAPMESGEGDAYYSRLREGGIRAFRACPRTFSHPFDPFWLEAMAAFLTNHRMPLFVDAAEIGLAELQPVLAAFPELKVLLTGANWGHNRFLYPLLERFGNLFFEISSDQANDILTIVRDHFGIERALFGTAWPQKSPGGLKALVEYAFISEADKDRVAYKNACALLCADESRILPQSDSPLTGIARAADEGRPLSDTPVIDAHTHMVDAAHRTTSSNVMLYSGADDIVHKMDRLGIDTVITCPWQGICTDGLAANETTLRAMRSYPGRFEGYACCNPNYDEDLEGVFRYHEDYGFIGIKPYWPYHKYDVCGPKYEKWYRYADAHGLLLLMHSGDGETARKTGLLAERYPNITFILAHTGIDYHVADMNLACAKAHPNVYLEITYTSLTYGMIEYLCSGIGADRVLYGSDLPMRDPAPQLGWVAYARIPEEDKKKILGGNIKALMDKIRTGFPKKA